MPSDSLSERDRARLAALLRDSRAPQRFQARKVTAPVASPTAVSKEILDTRPAAVSKGKAKPGLPGHAGQWAAGLGTFILCLAAVAVIVKLETRRDTGSIQLQARESKGELQIRWDPDSSLIRQAAGARLFIIDGAERLFVNLNNDWLRRGLVTYARHSDHVELRMALSEPGGRLIEEQATFLGPGTPVKADLELEAGGNLAVSPVQPLSPPSLRSMQTSSMPAPEPVDGHRSRTKPVMLSGTELPFTCSPGDVFHKTDAPAGWDTFACRGNNVWSLLKNRAPQEPATLTPKRTPTT